MKKCVEFFLRCCCVLGIWLAVLAGCSERQSQPATPLAAAPAPPQPALETMKGKVTAGGVPASYRAYFEAQQLKRIAETRATQSASAEQGEYEYYGARLTRYRGAPLGGAGVIELQFDLRGVLTSATGASGTVPDSEIGAIRSRAQLLRSHALTQRSVRTHQTD